MLEFARIHVGSGSGVRCVRCAAEAPADYAPSSEVAGRVAAVATSWAAGPGPNVVLAGPEPFAHPELPAIVAACVEAGCTRIALETDGAALTVPANAAGVLRAGVRHLRVRLLDGDPEKGDTLGGRPGRTRDALVGVRAYLAAAAEAGVAVVATAVVPVCRHNLESVPATVSAAAAAGFHAARLVPGGADALPASAGAYLAAACDTGMVNRLWVECDPSLPLPETHGLHTVAEAVQSD